ncbi:MAG: 30S ribosome-binding factor RbfA [Candidatus Kapaibacterium sp.]
MSLRTEKVGSLLKEIIAKPISDLAMQAKAGMATVTSVVVTPDLQLAKVNISCFAGKTKPEDFVKFLDSNKYIIKYVIAKEARLRFIPEVKFYLDDTLDQMDKIQEILDKNKSS